MKVLRRNGEVAEVEFSEQEGISSSGIRRLSGK